MLFPTANLKRGILFKTVLQFWPFTFTFTYTLCLFRFFENLYVGFGQKALPNNFEPAIPEFPMSEFPTGPEVIETEDPSPETEAAIRAAMKEQEAEEEDEEDAIIDDENDGGPDLSD